MPESEPAPGRVAERLGTVQLLARLRERQIAIAKQLPPALFDEYVRLEATITTIKGELHQYGSPPDHWLGFAPTGLGKPKRIPLAIHKRNVIELLEANGPMPRFFILGSTNVPPGSLSAVLKGKEFVRLKGGLWDLRKSKTKTGPSAPTAK